MSEQVPLSKHSRGKCVWGKFIWDWLGGILGIGREAIQAQGRFGYTKQLFVNAFMQEESTEGEEPSHCGAQISPHSAGKRGEVLHHN